MENFFRHGLYKKNRYLELFIRVRVVSVLVGMSLLGQLTVGLLDLIAVGALAHSQDSVEVSPRKIKDL